MQYAIKEELSFAPGVSEDLFGVTLFDDTAMVDETTRSATDRLNPISWVTTTMVRPSSASSRMTLSTSLTSSGSSADVGSSKSMALGFIASARAMATRCF